eukprot:s171_g44.t1
MAEVKQSDAQEVLYTIYLPFIAIAVVSLIPALFFRETLEAAHTDAAIMVQDRLLQDAHYVNTLETIFAAMDEIGYGLLTAAERTQLLQNPRVQAYLQTLDFNISDSSRSVYLFCCQVYSENIEKYAIYQYKHNDIFLDMDLFTNNFLPTLSSVCVCFTTMDEIGYGLLTEAEVTQLLQNLRAQAYLQTMDLKISDSSLTVYLFCCPWYSEHIEQYARYQSKHILDTWTISFTATPDIYPARICNIPWETSGASSATMALYTMDSALIPYIPENVNDGFFDMILTPLYHNGRNIYHISDQFAAFIRTSNIYNAIFLDMDLLTNNFLPHLSAG